MDNNKDIIRDNYNKLANNYDTLLSVRKIWIKIGCKIIWGFEDAKYANELLTWVPNDFSGKLLDIPTGTALFTVNKYVGIKNANIICMDYSQDMLAKAKEKFKQYGLDNIECMQGDVENLPFEDKTFDMVLSMNGFHAFQNKKKSFEEIHRILKCGGTFIGCYYIKDEVKRTDWFINNLYVPKKFFTPPFQNINETKSELGKDYNIEKIKTLGSIVYFKCIKKG
jgi:ubiquinone/menaquinone biosynthesis C-methylase UbiE